MSYPVWDRILTVQTVSYCHPMNSNATGMNGVFVSMHCGNLYIRSFLWTNDACCKNWSVVVFIMPTLWEMLCKETVRSGIKWRHVDFLACTTAAVLARAFVHCVLCIVTALHLWRSWKGKNLLYVWIACTLTNHKLINLIVWHCLGLVFIVGS